MTDNTENLVIEMLKVMRNETATFRAEVRERLDEITTRLGYLERAVDRVSSFATDTSGRLSESQVTMDRLTKRIERIERRLELQG
ncbi:MAG TPA: hypothetical protein VF292_03775 [Rhodanobacteraceae bacterium]